jgi:hypothetical protein
MLTHIVKDHMLHGINSASIIVWTGLKVNGITSETPSPMKTKLNTIDYVRGVEDYSMAKKIYRKPYKADQRGPAHKGLAYTLPVSFFFS